MADLLPLIQHSNRCLQRVELVGSALTAADISSLRVLPHLRRLSVSYEAAKISLPAVRAAGRSLRRHRPSAWQRREHEQRRRAAQPAGLQRGCCDERIAALSVWDEQAVRRRLSESKGEQSEHNLLHVEGLDVSAVRRLFFQALQEEMDRHPASVSYVGHLSVVGGPMMRGDGVEDGGTTTAMRMKRHK